MLEDANIKLNSVIADMVGVSGRRMIAALIAGESDPAKLASLAHRRRGRAAGARQALQGRVTQHHRFLLALHVRQIDALADAIAEIDPRSRPTSGPFAPPSSC